MGTEAGGVTAAREQPRVAASFDLTAACPLRCAHCYFYAGEAPPPDVADDVFVSRAIAARDCYGIGTAFWVGGEPLRRLDLLRRVTAQFHRKAVATSAMLPVPDDLDAGLLVSFDGLRADHDRLRGGGAFDTARANVRRLPPRSFVLSVTITAATRDVVDDLPALVDTTRALGAVVGLHTAPSGDALRLSDDDRDRVIDRLLASRGHAPGVVLNPPLALELLRPGRAAEVSVGCIYRHGAVAFDTTVRRKRPCTFGAQAACDRCGCALMALQAAAAAGDRASLAAMAAVFPPHAAARKI